MAIDLPRHPYHGGPPQRLRPSSNSDVRALIAGAKRVVVKIGSSSLTGEDHLVDPARIDKIVDALQARMVRGSDVIVVSSGAVAAGMVRSVRSSGPRILPRSRLRPVWGRCIWPTRGALVLVAMVG